MRQILVLMIAALMVAGCGAGDVQNDVPDTTMDEVTDDNPCPDGEISIDFPCNTEFECIDQKLYSRWRTMWCEDLGYDPRCCGGGMCAGLTGGECAADELCINGVPDGRCAKKDCGGDLAATCSEGQFCERPYGSCDGPGSEGVCLPRPTDCGYNGGCVWPGCDWECGCDGVTYGSLCDRFSAGTARFAEGPCCTPGKVSFDQDNTTASDGWEVCIKVPDLEPDRLDLIRTEIATIDPNVTCAAGGPTSTCSPSEIACRGTLAFESGSTRITDEAWSIVCRIAGFPYIDSVLGRGGPQCQGALGPVPFCSDGCQDPCGCEACTFNDRRCDDTDPMLLYTCDDGCWGRVRCQVADCRTDGGVETCTNGQVCVVLSGHASCYLDCDSLLQLWDFHPNYAYQGCTEDADCKVINGGCQVGLPAPCWAAVNVATTVEEAEAIQRQWQGTGCGGTICQCDGPRPAPKCNEGMCTVPVQ